MKMGMVILIGWPCDCYRHIMLGSHHRNYIVGITGVPKSIKFTWLGHNLKFIPGLFCRLPIFNNQSWIVKKRKNRQYGVTERTPIWLIRFCLFCHEIIIPYL